MFSAACTLLQLRRILIAVDDGDLGAQVATELQFLSEPAVIATRAARAGPPESRLPMRWPA